MKERFECMVEAESKCRKLKKGKIPWSPRLQKARDVTEQEYQKRVHEKANWLIGMQKNG